MKISLTIIALLLSFGLTPLFAKVSTSTQSVMQPKHAVRIPILIYHSVRPYYPGITNLVKEFTVPPDIFEDQLKYLDLLLCRVLKEDRVVLH